MSRQFVETALSLLPGQKQQIIDFAANTLQKNLPEFKGKQLLLRLAKNQLNGNDKLFVTKQVANRIAKARQQGKGVHIKLSANCMRQNQRGGALPAIAAALGPILANIGISSATNALKADSAGQRRIEDRLNYLRGNGMEGGNMNEAFKLGAQLAKQQMSMHGQKGEGFLGDFVDGFKYGFTHPFEAIELGVRELDRAISKPKKGRGMSGGAMPSQSAMNPSPQKGDIINNDQIPDLWTHSWGGDEGAQGSAPAAGGGGGGGGGGAGLRPLGGRGRPKKNNMSGGGIKFY